MKKCIATFIMGVLLSITIFAVANSFTALPATFNIYVEGEEFKSENPPLVIEGRTYLPLRAIGEALGINVDWNEELRRVEISKNNNTITQNKTDGVYKDEYYQNQIIPAKININTASEEELKHIIHIDDDRAKQIIKLRPFKSLEDLVRVNGIGNIRVQDIINEGKAFIE